MAASTLTIKILGDSSGFKRSLDGATRSAGGFGRTVGKIGKVAAVAFAGATVAAGAFVAQGANSLIRIEKIGAQTDAALKSTAGAAGVTRKAIEKLSGGIEAMSGVEAESIQEGQNLLLTFTKIRNEAGKGNDIFNQATMAMTDLSVAMGKDLQSSSILVGKALNDPIKGVTALTRAGVQFTVKQKEQIKALVESGDVMGAQKMILKELATQFGGSAGAFGQTTAGKIERFKHKLGEVQEELAAKLFPVIEKVTDWLLKNMPKAFEELQRRAQPVVEWLEDAFARFAEWVRRNWPKISAVLLEAFEEFEGWVRENWPKIQAVIVTAATGIAEAVEGLIGIWLSLWAIQRDVLLPVIKEVASALLDVLGPALSGIFSVINDRIIPAIDALVGWFEDNEAAAKTLAGIIGSVLIVKYVALAVQAFRTAAVVIASWVAMKTAAIASAAETAAIMALYVGSWARAAFAVRGSALSIAASWAIAAAPAALTFAAIAGVIALFVLTWEDWEKWFKRNLEDVKSNFLGIWNTIRDVTRQVWTDIENILTGIWDGIKAAYDNTIGKLPGFGGGLPSLPGVGDFDIPGVPFLAAGGVVTRPTLAVLGEGGPEAVVPLSQLHAASGGAPVIHIHMPPGTDGEDVVNAINRYVRRGNPRPGWMN